MPRRVPLPPEFGRRPFSVASAQAAGLSAGRLRGPDLEAPFHGVRWASPAAGAPGASGASGAPGASGAQNGELLARCHAYAQRMRPGQFFSHLTAARIWGAPMATPFRSDEALHVSTVSPQRPPHARGALGHQLRPGTPGAVLRHGLPVTDPGTTWLQLASLLAPAEHVVVGDHLVLDPVVLDPLDPRPFLTLAELVEHVARFHGAGARAATRAVLRVRAGAESRPETLLRLLLIDAGLPEPLLNRELRDTAARFLGRVDMLYPGWRVVVEYDGDQHRTSAAQYDRDISRLDGIRRAGWTVVQVRSRGLFVHPDDTVRRVRQALHDAGWRP